MAGAANSVPTESDLSSLAERVGHNEEEFEVGEDGTVRVNLQANPSTTACPDKPETGNRRVQAQFSRRRTHNEQIIVAPCGVIIARTTMYGAEAVTSVIVRGMPLVSVV